MPLLSAWHKDPKVLRTPDPLQKDAAQLMPTGMEAPHPQEIPGGVWPSEAALWEMHCLYTFPSSVQATSAPQETHAAVKRDGQGTPSKLPSFCYQVSWELREA